MPDHIGKLISNNVLTTLAGIDGGPTYNNDLSVGTRVFLYGKTSQAVNDRPSIVIHYLGEDKSIQGDFLGIGVTQGTYGVGLRLALVCQLSEGDATEASDVAWGFQHDVEVALNADTTRGGLAAMTEVTASNLASKEESLPSFEVLINFTVWYEHGIKDPAVNTPTT